MIIIIRYEEARHRGLENRAGNWRCSSSFSCVGTRALATFWAWGDSACSTGSPGKPGTRCWRSGCPCIDAAVWQGHEEPPLPCHPEWWRCPWKDLNEGNNNNKKTTTMTAVFHRPYSMVITYFRNVFIEMDSEMYKQDNLQCTVNLHYDLAVKGIFRLPHDVDH